MRCLRYRNTPADLRYLMATGPRNPGTSPRLRTLLVIISPWMGVAMRRRLKNFLPIVLFALAVQIFAPIAACWAAGVAASDPLNAAVICHGNATADPAQIDQTVPQGSHRGCCSLCGVLHTGAPVDTPQAATAALTVDRQTTAVVWHELALDPPGYRAGSPEQARAPPAFS